MVVVWGIFDREDNLLAEGENSTSLENIAEQSKLHGVVTFRMYHDVGDKVCVNTEVYQGRRRLDKTMKYVPAGELDLMAKARKTPEGSGTS